MKQGDIVFSKPVNSKGRGVVVLQWLHGSFGNWSHASVCVLGPLMIEAFKPDGIKLSIWRDEALSSRPYTAFRLKEPVDHLSFRRTCLYFLDQAYSLRARYTGESFCSFLVQQIYKQLDVPPFNRIHVTLTPNQLYSRLKKAENWQLVRVPVHSYEDLKILNQLGGTQLIERELFGICEFTRHSMLRELDMAKDAKAMTALVHEVQAQWDGLDTLLTSDLLTREKKKELLESFFVGKSPREDAGLLAYRDFEYDGASREEAAIETINSAVRKNWQHDAFDAAALSSFAVGRSKQKFDEFLALEVKLDDILFDILKRASDFVLNGQPESLGKEEFDFRANALVAVLFGTLRRRGATSNVKLDYIITELRKDSADHEIRTNKPSLVPLLERRIALLSVIQRFLSTTEAEMADSFWEKLYEAVEATAASESSATNA